ncbi:MAG: cytochrome c biogenesis protein ResB [Desulfosoma sp.]|uniref:cytochrome c biogenesis protein ResB n=1 Tax=Desulfosoma sp. TaxID=2603217 RepID=UPI00404AA108
MNATAERFRQLWRVLGSVRLALFLFLILAVGCLIGTLVPQGLSDREVMARYGPGTARWLLALRMTDLYHSLGFQALFVALSVNLIACTLQRLPKTHAILRNRDDFLDPAKLTKYKLHRVMEVPADFSKVRPTAETVLRSAFGHLQHLHAPADALALVAEKGRWSRYMVYVIHVSVLWIFLGALMGSLYGFKGIMNVAEGETTQEIFLPRQRTMIALPFAVRCNDFDVSFYENGVPKEFRSNVTVLEGDTPVLNASVRVNDPMSYRGITFYQASYGALLKRARVAFTKPDEGERFELDLPFGEALPFGATDRKVQLVDFTADFRGLGPAVAIATWKEGEQPSGTWILMNHPDFHGNRLLGYHVTVLASERGYYTGFQVKRDPGVPVVLSGFVALLIGLLCTFYVSHRKLYLWAHRDNPGTQLVIAARTNKKSLAFEREFQHICDRLADTLHRRTKGHTAP